MFVQTRSSIFALATIAGLALVAPAHAQDAVTRTQLVQTSDLDLTTAAGASALRHRVRLAARTVCGPAEMIGSPEFGSYSACLDDAEHQAQARSDALIASVRTPARFADALPR